MYCILWGLILFNHPQPALDYVNRLPTSQQRHDAKISISDRNVSVQYCRNYGTAIAADEIRVLPKVEQHGK